MGAYYFLACLLPPMPPTLGEKLPLSFPELSGMIQRNIQPDDDALLKGHLSVIDAANFENIEQGRDIFMEGGTMSREDLEARQKLPNFIREFIDEQERGIRRAYLYDRLWELCYEALLELAGREGCRYLLDYVTWELSLRNRLTALRFKEKGGNAEKHAILPRVQCHDFTDLLSRVEGQKNPLAAERYLDGERLKRIYHCEGSDPFSLDAILAFVSRSMIYSRWERLQTPYDIKNILSGGG